jgi:NADPH2:quinone reductase
MKAVLLKAFGGVENLEYREWPEPVASAGEVKIKTRTISVNPTDYKARQGGRGCQGYRPGR